MAISAIIALILQFCLSGLCYSNEPVDIESLHTKMLELEVELLRLKNKVCSKLEPPTQDEPRNVAFRSILSSNIKVTKGQTVVFDNVALNIGAAYNEYNGVFTAPYNGTYLFSVAIGNPTDNPSAFFMVQYVNNVREVIGYTIAGHTRGWNTGSLTTVTQLFIGDSVWVAGEGQAHGTYGTDRHHSGFSGALIHTQ